MKKLWAILLVFALFSCSKEDESSKTNNNSNNTNNASSSNVSVNPPSWIIGKWIFEYSTPSTEQGYEFRNNTFIQIPTSGSEIDWGQRVQQPQSGSSSLTDDLTNNTYSVHVEMGGSTTTYSFKKIDSDTIDWLESNSSGYYVRQ